MYIVKPDEGSQGDGIYLITEAKEYILNSKRHVVQEYLADPLLLEDLKFDFRLYAVIASLEPLRVRIRYNKGYHHQSNLLILSTSNSTPNSNLLQKCIAKIENCN